MALESAAVACMTGRAHAGCTGKVRPRAPSQYPRLSYSKTHTHTHTHMRWPAPGYRRAPPNSTSGPHHHHHHHHHRGQLLRLSPDSRDHARAAFPPSREKDGGPTRTEGRGQRPPRTLSLPPESASVALTFGKGYLPLASVRPGQTRLAHTRTQLRAPACCDVHINGARAGNNNMPAVLWDAAYTT
jgi:hypothetical protein